MPPRSPNEKGAGPWTCYRQFNFWGKLHRSYPRSATGTTAVFWTSSREDALRFATKDEALAWVAPHVAAWGPSVKIGAEKVVKPLGARCEFACPLPVRYIVKDERMVRRNRDEGVYYACGLHLARAVQKAAPQEDDRAIVKPVKLTNG